MAFDGTAMDYGKAMARQRRLAQLEDERAAQGEATQQPAGVMRGREGCATIRRREMMRQLAGATRRRREDVTTRRRDNERAAHREAKQHTAGATRGQEGGARSDLLSSKTTTRTTADRDTRVWDPTQRRVGGRIDQRTAGTGFGVIGRAVRVGLMLFGYKRWGREQRHRGTDDDERGCRRGREDCPK